MLMQGRPQPARRGHSELRHALGFLSPHARDLKPLVSRDGHGNARRSQLADGRPFGSTKSPLKEGSRQDGSNARWGHSSNWQRIERVEQRHSMRCNSQMNSHIYSLSGKMGQQDAGMTSESRHQGDAIAGQDDQVRRSSDTSRQLVQNLYTSGQLQDFAIKELKTQKLFDHPKQSSLILDTFPKNREQEMQRNLIREQKLQNKKQRMDLVHVQEDRRMYEKRKEAQRLALVKKATRGQVAPFQQTRLPSPGDADRKGNCSRLCRQLNEFIEGSSRSRRSPPTVVGGSQRSHKSSPSISKERQSGPPLINFEIHGTSKRRYEAIHDTINLFNYMKEERDAALDGKIGRNQGTGGRRSPSLLAYNDKDSDPNNRLIYQEIEQNKQRNLQKQHHLEQYQESKKAFADQLPEKEGSTHSGRHAQSKAGMKRAAQLSLPSIKQIGARTNQRSVNYSNLNSDIDLVTKEPDLVQGEDFNFVSGRGNKLEEKQKLLHRLKEKHLKYNLDLTANAKYSKRSRKHTSSYRYSDRIQELYADGPQLEDKVDHSAKTPLRQEAKAESESASTKQDQEKDLAAEMFSLKKTLRHQNVIQSETMKKFNNYEQILNDSLRDESKIVEKSIEKLALELSKAKMKSKRISRQDNASTHPKKMESSPGCTEKETAVDENARNTKSNQMGFVEQKHRDIWQLMDKKNIFIDSSKASEVHTTSHSPHEKAAALPQSEQVQRNKNPYKTQLLTSHVFDQRRMPSPLDEAPKKSVNSAAKVAGSHDAQQKPSQAPEAHQHDDNREQTAEHDAIKSLFNEIQDHERNIQQLQIIDSIKRGIQNSTRERKKNIDIEQIKSLRSTALGQSNNQQLSKQEQLSSKLLVNDLNLLSQQMGAPPQTQAAAVVQDDLDGEQEEVYSVKPSELTDADPHMHKSRSLSKVSKYLGSYRSLHPLPKQEPRRKPVEEYHDKDLLPSSLNMSILPKNSNKSSLRSPIQKQIFIQKAQERSVKLNQQERRLKALTNMIKQNRGPDPGTYQQNFKSQLKPIQESFEMVSPGIRRKRRRQDDVSSLFADSCLSDQRMRSQLQELRSPSPAKEPDALKSSPKRGRSSCSKDIKEDRQMPQFDLIKPSHQDQVHGVFDFAQTMAQESKDFSPPSKNLPSSCSAKDKQFYEKINISLGHSTINKNILDPDIDDEERQYLYQLFKEEQLARLQAFVKRSKKRHRIKNPWEYDSDDSLASLQSEGKPYRMYGRLPRDKQTGEVYRIPSLEQIKKILMDGEKSTKQIVDALFPRNVDYRDLLCALAIMHNSKLLSTGMLKKLSEREDRLAEHVNWITGEKLYQHGGLLSADKAQDRGLTKHLSKSFSEYVDSCDQAAKRVAQSLVSKSKYFYKCKLSFTPKIRHELQSDPEFNYFITCHDKMELAMPILEKVFSRTLCLHDYTLSPIHTNALRLAARFFDNFINRLLLDNCGLTDQQFSALLDSLAALQDFKAVTYRNQEFGPKSADAIQKLVKRRIPNHLDELVLYNCKMANYTVERLLMHLNERSHLSKLALVNANLSDRCVKLLLELMANNKYIHSLDIGWNNLKPKSYEQLLLFLRDNRTMRSVNLAWNNLVDGPTATRESKKKREQIDAKKALSERSGSPADTKGGNMTKNSFMMSHAVSFDKSKMEDQEWQMEVGEHELLVADCLTRFIKYNANLLHFDLQGTGLTEYCIKMIAKALRKSRSIVGIHLSENPGLTDETRKYLYERVRCKNSDFALQRPLDLHIYEERAKRANARVDHCMFQDSIKLREINERKRAQKKLGIVGPQKDDRLCVLTRFNGHKGEMPGSPGQWQMLAGQHEECWICDKWTFSLVFFNPARLEDKSLWNQCDELKQYLIKQMQLFHGDAQANKMEINEREEALYESAFPSLANENVDEFEEVHLYANFTNWQPKRMIPFLNYIERIDKDKPDFLAKLKKDNKISQRVQSFEDLKDEELEAFAQELYEYRKKIREGHWERLLQKNLRFTRPAILNLDPRELERPQRLYVLPIYVKSGKQNMLIKFQDMELGTCDWFFQRTIVDFRVEDINLFKKPLSSFLIQRKFQKQNSVFADWIEDDEHILQKCKDDAALNWKVLKMKIDPEDKDALLEVLNKHFPVVKHIFIWLQSLSDAYPGMTGLDYSRFMHNIKMIDNNLSSSRVDQLFLRSIMLNDPRATQPIVMYRWSFLESLIRVCKERYIDTGQEKTYAAALNRLMCKKIIPSLGQVDFEPWQELREDYIWTLEIDDLLRANLEGIQKVYSHFSSKRKITHDECCKIFTHNLPVPLPAGQAKLAYGMSKMSVTEEMRPSDSRGYMQMEFVEFLEMICRVAILKFKATDMDSKELPDKVEYLLEELLAIVGVEKQKAQLEQVEVSESDEDY